MGKKNFQQIIDKKTVYNTVPYCIAMFGGVRAATLASTFRPTGQERCPEIRYDNMHQTVMVKQSILI